MMRQGLLWLSEQRQVFDFVRRNGVARQMASRFVAGETTDEAVAAAETLQRKGIASTLDLLGESVTRAEEADAAGAQYVAMVDEMARRGVPVNVSVKLTQMGFDLEGDTCRRNVLRIVERAAAHDGFVRLDMESSAYTQRTIDFYFQHVYPSHRAHCGLVLQSALKRTDADVELMVQKQVRIRLCKGAYLEPAAVAYQEKSDVDKAFLRQAERLVEHGAYVGLATHDEAILGHVRKFVQRQGIGAERYEFQMLYGVRRDLQEQLREAGHNMRVYIPFGTQWYPYLMRRLAERPANIAFILGNIVKESVPGL
jgi:proline dehydrogenase